MGRRLIQLLLSALLALLPALPARAQAIPCDVQPQQPACIEAPKPKRPSIGFSLEIRPVIKLEKPVVAKPRVKPKPATPAKPVAVSKPKKTKPLPLVPAKPVTATKKPAPHKVIAQPAVQPSWFGLAETDVPLLAGSDFDDIAGQYIVDFDPAAFLEQGLDLQTIPVPALANLLGLQAAQIRSVQRVFLLSAVLRASPAQAQALTRNPLVRAVHADTKIKAMGGATKMPPLSWGLDRLDVPTLPLDGNFDRDSGTYQARLYVLDSGIDATQPEFGGRVKWGARFALPVPDTSGHCRDHGTEMASLVGGITTGSAPKAEIIDVVVLPCSRHLTGQGSSLIEAAEWLLLRERDLGETRPVVVNMSLAGKWSRKINEAVSIMTRNNVAVVVAAGNNSADACRFSPASAKDAVTVAATAPEDIIPGFSNHGSCVDIHAPGKLVTAVSEGKAPNHVAVSGTSGAAALVSGLLARGIEAKGPKAAEHWLEKAAVPQNLWLKSAKTGSAQNMLLAQMDSQWRSACRVLDGALVLRDRPGPAARKITSLAAGTMLSVEDVSQDWVRVRSGKSRGWISMKENGKRTLVSATGAGDCEAAR